MNIKNIVLFAAMLMISGCATSVKNPDEIRSDTKITYDKYSGSYSIEGPKIDTGEFPNMTTMSFIGFIKPNYPQDRFALYVYHWSQTGWNFFNQASDSDAIPLEVKPLNQNVTELADVEEEVAIALPRDYLTAHEQVGLNIRLLGTKGFVILVVPGAYIHGFLERFDAERAAHNAPASRPAPVGLTLGINYLPTSQAMADALRLGQARGVMVVRVVPASPADRAGLRPGDIILTYSGKQILSETDLRSGISQSSPGTAVSIGLWRNGGEDRVLVNY